MKLILLILFSSIAIMANTTETTHTLTAKEIIKKLDSLYRGESSYAVVEMKIETSYFKRTLKMKMWSKGTENTLVKILKPKKDKGISTLKTKNDIYNYFPKINKVMKVPSSMMMGSWMGSDFTNDDLVKESTYTKDYDFKLIKADNDNQYKLELKPKKNSVTVWGKIIIILDKKTVLPLNQEYYDEHDKKVRVMNFKDVKQIGEKLLPTTMELIPLTKSKKGNKTTITYKKIKFNIDLKANFFSLQNLRNR